MVDAHEKLRITVAENEKLRETNEIQNKLWKIWLKEFENGDDDSDEGEEVLEVLDKEKSKNKVPTRKGNKDERVERKRKPEIEKNHNEYIDKEDKDKDENNGFNRRKEQGFKRNGRDNNRVTSSDRGESRRGGHGDGGESGYGEYRRPDNVRKRYCHYWNNGKCRYSDRECNYLHEEAPECWYRNCSRSKCMFYYPADTETHF